MTILQGDCREVLPTLGPVADVAIVDPPYGTTSLGWDKPISGLIASLDAAIKPNGSIWVFGQLRSLLQLWPEIIEAGYRYAQDIVWEKHNGSSIHNDRFRKVHELAMQIYRAGERWDAVYKSPQTTNDAQKRTVRRKFKPSHFGSIGEAPFTSVDGGPRLMRSVLAIRSCHGQAEHPTQKPTELLRHLIEYSCPPNGTVLDPTAGSGSTIVAAMHCGRKAIGIEANPAYIAIIERRCAQRSLLAG